MLLRIIKEPFLKSSAKRHAQADDWLESWRKVVRAARWKSIAEVRKTYPHADAVAVKSGRTATVFNVKGNEFRLITAIHYKTQIIFTLRFLTHAEYSKGHWQTEL